MKSDMAMEAQGEKMKRAVFLALLAGLLVLAMALKGVLVPLPAVPAPAEAGGFDTERAMARLGRILGDQRPHPVDSDANDAIRARLVAELRAIGLDPVVTDDLHCNGRPRERSISCARVRNVVATVGPAEGRHVLMVSHYDSTPAGPGAADDGIGVAAMLETAAVLRARPPARPVTFLFNEGEEAGLIGARAFLDRNPIAERVDTLVNLESRGTTGPAIMFETSRPNAAAIALYAKSARNPSANSLTTDFSRLIPNTTDVAVLNERPWTILNFAIIGNETRYHAPGDRLEALDPRSLAHMGAQALAAVSVLSAGPPPQQTGSDLLYMDVLGSTLVTLPLWLGTGLLVLLLAGFSWLAWSRRGGVGRGSGAVLLGIADAAFTTFLLQWIIGLARPGEFWRAHPELISTAVDVTAIASAATALLWVAGPVARDRLRLAYWLVFLLVGALLTLVAPGAAIFFLLPPLIAFAGFLVPRFARPLALLAWAALFLTWVPLLHLSQTLLDFDAAWTFAPIAVLIAAPVLIELKGEMASIGRGKATAALAGAAVVAWLPAALAPACSEDRKQRMSIEYVWDDAAKSGRSMLYHDGGRPPEAMGAFERGVEVPWSGYERWAGPAGGPPVPPPALEKLAEQRIAAGRLVTLRLRANGAETVRMRAEPEADLKAVRVGGAVRRFGIGEAEEDFGLRCHGRSCDGFTFQLLIGAAAPVELTITGVRSGLPPSAQPLAEARPATAAPQYVADSTVATGKIRL